MQLGISDSGQKSSVQCNVCLKANTVEGFCRFHPLPLLVNVLLPRLSDLRKISQSLGKLVATEVDLPNIVSGKHP